jgi:protein-S-isoprenylcysteine O-methyltransferase Ste14
MDINLHNLIFTVLALRKFWLTKNTLITAKPARSLQTSGIYSLTRNPMYLGLLLLYTGFSCFTNNCWTLILLPLLFIIIQEYVIKREENYLDRAFAEKYNEYKRKVRRWI